MKIFIGHDSFQAQNTEVCIASIRKYNKNIEIIPIVKSEMERDYGFNRENDGSTEFTYTRFLVPYICRYQGIALFCDSDFVWLCDPEEILGYYDDRNAVSCVQHNKMPVRSKEKMQGQVNESYPRKWWSSLMLFNCEHQFCRRLNPDSINQLSAQSLHRMHWAAHGIGELPVEYNYLVGYYDNDIFPKALHFTDGTPLYESYRNEPYADKYLEFIRDTELR